MFGGVPFDYVVLPYCGAQTAQIARRLLPYYHCVFISCVDESQIESLCAEGFYYRPRSVSQDLLLEGSSSIEEHLQRLKAKRRNDILQSVNRAQKHGIEVSVEVFKHRYEEFRNIYSWYFDVYRPYASTRFPNAYKYKFVEDLNSALLHHNNPFVLATAKWNGKIVGASILIHLPCSYYQMKSSFRAGFPGASGAGNVLQMFMLNSRHDQIGNINTYVYYRIIDWCIRQRYSLFSFGEEDIILPEAGYLNVLGSKRSWATTTVLHYDRESYFLLCNSKALLYLPSDYYLFHWDSSTYSLIYFANIENVPKILSQWLEGDIYLSKRVYTRRRSIFSYLEQRAQRWKNSRLILCSSEGTEETSLDCP